MKSCGELLLCLKRAFINPFTSILLIIAAASFLMDRFFHSGGIRYGANVPILLLMVLLGGGLRLFGELRAKRVSDKLLRLTEVRAEAYRDGSWKKLLRGALSEGDRIRLRAGDRVPADIRIEETETLFVSESALTGEGRILKKKKGDTLYFGSAVVGGTCEGIVSAVGKHTRFGDFGHFLKDRKSGFERGADSIAWVLIRFMAVLVPAVFLACGLTKGDWPSALLFALSVAVGLTPEMLPMVANACLVKGGAAMEKKGTIVKNINAMQGFGSMDVLCVDKTGTLTDDRLQLEYYMDILGNESGIVLDFAYLNSLYHTGTENPLDRSILFVSEIPAKKRHFAALSDRHEKLSELPFDYERRFDSVLVRGKDENLLLVKGSPEQVLSRCSFVEYCGRRTEICGQDTEGMHAVVDEMREEGMKVLAVAYKPMGKRRKCVETDETALILLGYLGFFDAPKKSAEAALLRLRDRNVSVKVLTGDQRDIAASVMRRLGFPADKAVCGGELASLSDDALLLKAEACSLFAELSPEQKARIVDILHENGHTVGFLGDGMNDLPAVLCADVGISVDTAAEAVKECADVILLKKDLGVLEEGILEGRKAFSNLLKYIKITASSNFGNILSIVVAGIFLPFLPMTAVQLLLLNLLYDALCLVLPWDPVDEDAYSRPQIFGGAHLGRFMRFFGPLSSFFDLAAFLFLYFLLCPGEASAGSSQFISFFQTGWFLESMWTQVLILYFLRTKKLPLLESRPSAPVLLITVLGMLCFTALPYTPLGGALGLCAMPPYFYGFLTAVVALYVLLVTAAKALYIKRYGELI